MHRMGLGTAQFGLDYGLTSGGAAVAPAEIEAILRLASQAGIGLIDTAAAYGSSEAALGRALERLDRPGTGAPFRIVTKLPSLAGASSIRDKLELAASHLERSLARLGVARIHGLMLHDAGDLAGEAGRALCDRLAQWRSEGRIQRAGVSVYDAAQVELALALPGLDLIQLPLSVFDQRLHRSGHIAELGRQGFEVHARSVLLQGLLLMGEEELPTRLRAAAPALARYRAALATAGVSPLAAALGFVKGIAAVSHFVVGVHSSRHLSECLAAFDAPCALAFEAHALDNLDIVDPRRWSLNP